MGIEIKCCPVETAVKYIGKKWTIHIIRDMFMGKKHFSEFLEANPNLSTKMLSQRLKELEGHNVIEKKIVSTSPVTIEYHLTKKGKALNKVLYELVMFSFSECKDEVVKSGCKCSKREVESLIKNTFVV